MSTYTITVTDNGDVAAVANGGTASIVVSDGTSSGAGGGGAVDSVNGHAGVVVLDAADVGADASGAAATAQATAETYTDTQVAAEVTRANAAYDAAGAAAAAQAAAIAASQPVDSDLTAIAALTTTSFGRGLLALADAAALRSTAGLGDAATHAAADFDTAGAAAAAQAASQPLDSDLTAIAALATTSFGRSLLTAADAAAARVLTGAGTSSLALGTTSTTAKAGDYQPSAANISDSTTIGRTIITAADAAAVRTAIGLATVASTGAYSDLTGKPTLGTAAAKDIPASGNASSTQVVYGSDTRLADSRTPTAHASTHASAGSDPITIAESQVTNLTSDLAAKAPLASPTFTGDPKAPTPTAGDSDTSIATTAFVATSFAPLASPALTGNPTVPTQAAGTNSTRAASTAYTDNAVAKQPEVLMFALGDESTAITIGTKVTFRIPFAFTITEIRASLTTASSSGIPAVDVKKNGTTVFSTALTIDATEKTSKTAATPAVLSTTSLSDDDEIALSVTTAGTGAAGLKVTIIGTRS